MSKKILHNISGLVTAEDIATAAHITVQSVYRKKGLSEYRDKEVPSFTGKGRPTVLYRKDVLILFDVHSNLYESSDMAKTRKKRTDVGKKRSMSQEIWELGVPLIRNAYINHATRDCRLMCERVCAHLHDIGFPEADADKFYKAIMRSELARENSGVLHAENWEDARLRNMHRSKTTLTSATPGYDRFSILMDAGFAGKGFGACRIIVIDDFKRDAWVNLDGTPTMPEGLAFIDGLTGFPLLYEPCTSLTTAAVARGILKVAFMWGLYSNTVWVIENSKAMKNINIDGLISTLYTNEDLEDFKNQTWISQYFDGQPPSPIIHSLPHIPRHKSKAMIESQFNRIKHEYDAVDYALQFQGGNRNEAVTFTRARMPYFAGKDITKLPDDMKLVPYDEYWTQLHYWMYCDSEMSYIDRIRPKFRSIAKSLGINATLREVFTYFNDNSGRKTPELDIERYSKMLYFSQPERTKPHRLITPSRNNRNGINCTIDTQTVILIHNSFLQLIGHRVAVIPVPYDDTLFVVMRADQPENPQFVGIFKNQMARKLEEVPIVQKHSQIVRETCDRELDKVIEQSKQSMPALSPHREAIKNTTLTPNTPNLLSDKDSVGWIDTLQDDIVDNIEANQRSRAIVEVPLTPEQPKINFINNRRKAFLAEIEASLQEISNG